jgi:uncharacterized protein
MCRAKGFRHSDREAAPSPIPDRERILYLDILRGIALFGILVINLQDFEGPLARPENPVVQSIIDIFVQGKFITLFSFLFGIGFASQMSRAGQKGLSFLSFYPRRLASLALFGLIHGIVIWSGDILLTYAIIGALLLMFRNQSQKALLYWAGAVVAVQLLCLSVMQIRAATGESESAPIDAHRSIVQLLSDNWHSWVARFEYVMVALPLLSVFLIGLWVWRTGAVEHLADYRPVLKRICVVCLPVGLALNTASEVLLTVRPDAVSTEWFADVLGVTFAPILSAGYASGLALLILSDMWKRRFLPLAAVGRMALTNYLMQSVVCTAFFYLTGLYGKLGPAWDVLFAVVLYGLQIVYSNWWLARHRYGPMEWLWRRMTYGSPNLMP